MKDKIKTFIALLAVFLCFGIVGQMDYEDAKRLEKLEAAVESQSKGDCNE